MSSGVVSVMLSPSEPLLWSSPLGSPRRNVAIALPSVALPLFVPVDDVNSRPKPMQPAEQPGFNRYTPIRRKSAPSLNVCAPTNREYAALPPDDLYVRFDGLIAPSSCWLTPYPVVKICGNFLTPV